MVVGVSPVQWSSSPIGASFVLSGGNLIATKSGAAEGWSSVVGTVFRGTGKYYCEIITTGSLTYTRWGIYASTATNLDGPIGTLGVGAVSAGYQDSNNFIGCDDDITTDGPGASPLGIALGGVVQLAINGDDKKGWIGYNNTWYTNASGAGNPVTGVYPTWGWTGHDYSFTPAASGYGQGTDIVHTLVSTRPFTYNPPTGFTAWAGE